MKVKLYNTNTKRSMEIDSIEKVSNHSMTKITLTSVVDGLMIQLNKSCWVIELVDEENPAKN